MSESSLQIPANTSARLAKTPMHEVAVPYQGLSVVKPKRRVSETSTYLAFLHLAADSSISSQDAGEDAAIDTSEETTGSPTVSAPALEEGEIEEESNLRLKRKRSVLSASGDALDQELLKLAAGTSTSSENSEEDTTVERVEATTESLVLSRPALEEGEIEEEHQTPDTKGRSRAQPSQTNTNLSQEFLALCEFESSASPEAGTFAVDVSAATMESLSFPRRLLSTLTFQSLLSTHAASPPQGVSFYFHFRETWSNFGTCMEEDPEPESYVPEVDGNEVERGRVDDVTRTIIDGKRLARSHCGYEGVGRGANGDRS